MAAGAAVAVRAALDAAEDGERGRALLRGRMAHLLPALGPEDCDAAARHVQALLGMLARDHTAHVRGAVLRATRSMAGAPRDVAATLADDDAFGLSDPARRLAPALTDADLLALLATPPLAVAADSYAEAPVIRILLGDPSPSIQEATLDALVGRAPGHAEGRGSLTRRPCLSEAAADALAQLVADDLLDVLRARHVLAPAVIDVVRRQAAAFDRCCASERDDGVRRECEQSKAEGRLDEPFFMATLRSGHLRRAAACLAVASGVGLGVIDRVVELRNARALVSLIARAGFSMRACLAAQVALLQLGPDQLLRPTEPGGGYPLSDEEMQWQLELHLEGDTDQPLRC